MAVSNGTIYEFADFRVVPEDNLLLRDGESIPLPPKAFSTLVLLIEHHGHLVRKEDLIEKIWENSYVEEAAVSRCVWTIRSALGEDSKSQRFIQTVPKCGYKFVADVVEYTDTGHLGPKANGNGMAADIKQDSQSAGGPAIRAAAATEASPWHQHRPVVAAAVVFGLLGLVIIAGSFLFNSQAKPAGAPTQFAVLPLKPIDTTNRSNFYEIGVAEGLIHRLNSIKGFVARPLSAIRQYDALDQDPIAAGREQKVDKVLESSYQIADGKFRLTAQLINVASGQVEDSYKVETDSGNVFAIQDAVASEIGNRLMARFGATTGPERKRGTSNEEAYRNYLQGMFLIDQRNGSKAVENLDRAVALDPNYALAWAGKALAHRAAAITKDSDTRREYESALLSINRALALDPSLADAYSALCSNRFQFEYDPAGAEPACKRALELEPNSSIAHQTYTTFLNTRGRHDEAIASIKAAIDLDPSSFYNQRSYANSLYLARRYDEARVEYLRLWERNRNQRQTLEWMIRALDLGGREAEAFEWFVELSRLDKVDEKQVERFKTIFRTVGWLGVLREREKMDTSDDRYFGRALVNARIGDIDRAFALLNKFYEERSGMMPILQIEPMLDPLRGDPRYAELVRRMESK
jgi:DNA-binding winged helix-turn-helix (wHTH) protein/Tfp pilus assembly protein PilF